ncbi:hypothetical protein GCM10010193_26050 [Kitasatospora atroaurantiaca]
MLGGARPVAGARAARPQRVGVEVDPLGGDASMGHRAEPAVAERERVEEVVGGVAVPERVGGGVVIERHIDKLNRSSHVLGTNTERRAAEAIACCRLNFP